MIYLFVGNDNKSKNLKLKTLTKGREVISLSLKDLVKTTVLDYASMESLFGEVPFVVVDNLITESDLTFSKEELETLGKSRASFFLFEDKLLAADIKKYSKYATIENFDKKIDKAPMVNTFAIADAFSLRDKMGAWVSYNEAIEKGITGEAIAGILFWKIKMMIINGSKVFTPSELKSQSSRIVSLYHKAHNGEGDLAVGIEQFILSSLSK